MTVLDTTKLSSDDIQHLTDEQKADLPTILDIVEYVSSLENAEMREHLNSKVDFLGFSHVGKYMCILSYPEKSRHIINTKCIYFL